MTSTNDWSTYNGLLRELHQSRTEAEARGASDEETVRDHAEQLDELAGRVREQESKVVKLAYDLRKPVRFVDTTVTDPAPALPWDSGVADLDEHLDAADRAVHDVEYYGQRPPLLPTWPDWARNAVIYLAYSLPNVCINGVLWLSYTNFDGLDGRQFTAAAWGCCFWPVAVVIAGMATIRAVGVPRLRPDRGGTGLDRPKEHPVKFNVLLGFAISIVTSAAPVALIWLMSSALGV